MKTRPLLASALSLFYFAPSWLLLVSCKPSLPSASGQNQTRQEQSANSASPDAQHQPGTDDLARFMRGTLPPQLKLTELKNDPPVPLPGAAPGSNAWSYNVRVIFVLTEDVFGPPAPHHAAVFREAVDELNELAAWSQAYTHSPYAGRYPSLIVDPPAPANPVLLALVHAKDQPYPPLYWKMSAEWQVDHWNYAVTNAQMPADDGGKLRSQYKGPILIQNSPEAEQFMAQVKAGLEAARPKKVAIDAAYHADLLKATQPGMTYKGTLTHGKNVLPAEARFLAAAPGDGPNAVRMEFRLPEAGYTYLCSAHLAASPPVQPIPPKNDVEDRDGLSGNGGKPAPKADLAVGYLGVTDPKSTRYNSPAFDFRSATMTPGVEDKFWLSIQNSRLAGKMTLYDCNPPYFFDGQQVP